MSFVKILYNLRGQQSLVEVMPNGGVTPEATVLWDERVDGPFPQGAPVGYAARTVDGNGKTVLTIDAAMKAAFDAAAAAEAAKATQAAQDKSDFQTLKDKIFNETATALEVRKAFKFLLKKLGE